MAVMLQEIGINSQDKKEEQFGKIMDQEMPGYNIWTSVEKYRRRRGVAVLIPQTMSAMVN